jgi:hypothetical protein
MHCLGLYLYKGVPPSLQSGGATLRGSLFAQPCGLLLRSTTPHRSRNTEQCMLQQSYQNV